MSQTMLSERPYANPNPFTGNCSDERHLDRDEGDSDKVVLETIDGLQRLRNIIGQGGELTGEVQRT